MIEQIEISGTATFGSTPSVLDQLSVFNFFYGPNGSGKTTISRLIEDVERHPSCSLVWKNGREMETLVYNRDFVDRVFVESDDLPGIFSLGNNNKELLADIKDTNKQIDKLKDERDKLKVVLDGHDGDSGKRGELIAAKQALTEACWQKRARLGESCNDAFAGFRNSKSRFVEEVLSRQASKGTEIRTKQYLQERAETIFGDPPSAAPQLTELDYSRLTAIGNPPILAKAIVGKKDIDIAALIKKLGNSDWVKAGQDFLTDSEDRCPFCQQHLPASLEQDLNDYFDESYLRDMAEIKTLRDDYNEAADELLGAIDTILTDPPTQLDATKVKDKRDVLSARLTKNRAQLTKKKQEPSSAVTLEETDDLAAEIAALIKSAIDDIAAHNAVVRNHAAEKKKLTDECWKYLIEDELKTDLSTYFTTKASVEKAIESIETKLKSNRKELTDARQTLARLQKQTTSVEPTIAAINGVLQSFGFDGFKLAAADTPHCYKLVRSDGTDAKETLSEGERTFLTFLYFYNLIQGSHDESGAMNDRVIVFDDPVSSLDSDVLFIVSTLIKRVQQDVLDENNPVKQLFVLTHNVYFHKEVTFDSRGSGIGANHKRYWTIRKYNGCSSVTSHERNPIKTGYDLLWAELRGPSRSTVATQNAMRRILEHYFKVLGGREPLDICKEFEGADQLICRSLISWINDGSHHASDDLYLVVDQETIENYERVFRLIFEKTNHIGHYEMMMGSPPAIQLSATERLPDEADDSLSRGSDKEPVE